MLEVRIPGGLPTTDVTGSGMLVNLHTFRMTRPCLGVLGGKKDPWLLNGEVAGVRHLGLSGLEALAGPLNQRPGREKEHGDFEFYAMGEPLSDPMVEA